MLNYTIKASGGTWNSMAGFATALTNAMAAGLTDDWTVYLQPGFVDPGTENGSITIGAKNNKTFNNKTVLVSTDPSNLNNLATIKGRTTFGTTFGMASGGNLIFEHLKVLSTGSGLFNCAGAGSLTFTIRNNLLYFSPVQDANTLFSTQTGVMNVINNSVFVSSAGIAITSFMLHGGNANPPSICNFINNLVACYGSDITFNALPGITFNASNNTFWNYSSGNAIKGANWTTDTNNLFKPTAGSNPALNSLIIQTTTDSNLTMAGRDAKDNVSSLGVYQNGMNTSAYALPAPFEAYGLTKDVIGNSRTLPYDRGAYEFESATPSGPTTSPLIALRNFFMMQEG